MTGIFDQVKEKKESAFLAGIKQRAAALNKHIVLPEGEDVRRQRLPNRKSLGSRCSARRMRSNGITRG